MVTLVGLGLSVVYWISPLRFASAQPTSIRKPDVVLVTLDTTRADRIGAYGYTQANTPVLDEMAAQGRRYAVAYSPIPYTIPAHAAIFTGRSPRTLGLHTNGRGIAESEATLAEQFHAAGYATVASVGAVVTARMWGFDQGFDAYFDDMSQSELAPYQRPGDQVVDDILSWLDHRTRQPVFAWVHLFDPHSPHGMGYDDEIHVVDQQVGRLRDAFSLRPTLFVVVGDHGEGLGDHGESEHGRFVYDSTQRVPYLMVGPNIRPDVVQQPVSLIDVAPTLLQQVELAPLPRAEGQIVPGGEPTAPIYLESWGLFHRYGLAPHRAIVAWPYKLVAVPKPELYHLLDDPKEQVNLAAQQPDRVAKLTRLVGPLVVPQSYQPDDETAEMLAMLGYTDQPASTVISLEDAKDHTELIEGIERADAKTAAGNWPAAIRQLAKLNAVYPTSAQVTVRLARLEALNGHTELALERLLPLAKKNPDDEFIVLGLVDVLVAAGKPAQAGKRLAALARTKPHLPGLHARAIRLLSLQPATVESAISLGLHRLYQTPGDAEIAGLVGVLMARQGETTRAVPYLEQATSAIPPVPEVHFFLARAADEAGNRKRCIELLKRELAAFPDNRAAAMALHEMQSSP